MAPTLLFLHGVGDGNPQLPWLQGLNIGLLDAGFASLDGVRLVEPDYRDLLQAEQLPTRKLPPRSERREEREEASRGTYEIGRSSLQRLLGQSGERVTPVLPDPGPVMAPVVKLGDFPQAQRYVDSERLRAAVLQRILDRLPAERGDLVIVGHSLGSVVAIDLLDHLPDHLIVRRLVTIGSPAGIARLDGSRLIRGFPYRQVKSWLNILSRRDVVTGARGLAWRYPAALDIAVTLPWLKHSAFEYLATRPAALGVGEAMFGSLETGLVKPSNELAVRLGDVEAPMIAAIAYAHAVHERLKVEEPKDAVRYGAALTVVQREVGERLIALAIDEGRSVPREIVDLTEGRQPVMPDRWRDRPDDALQLLINSATTNLVRPFTIDDDGANYHVLEQVAASLGAGAAVGAHVRGALEDAKAGLKGGFRWEYVLMGAAGLGLLALGPIGIAAGGAAGAAGAAALTSGLAAFGPGGMVGGLALAGALGAGGAAAVTASGLALAQASSVPLEVQVLRHMAHALTRQRLRLPRQFADWDAVCEIESGVAAELAAHAGISDDDSDVVKALKKRMELCKRAIAWMLEMELAPEQPDLNEPVSFIRRIDKGSAR